MKREDKQRILTLVGVVLWLLAGCDAGLDRPGPAVPQETAPVMQMLHVKWTPALADRMARLSAADRSVLADSLLPSLHVRTAGPVFTGPPVFEARTRAAGLDQWYEIGYEAGPSAVKSFLSGTLPEGVLCMEEPQAPAPQEFTVMPFGSPASPATRSVISDLDDPLAAEQWHLYNDGTPSLTAVKGYDLELLGVWPAWRGSSEVTVAVLDGGVMTSHPDLAGAMWINAAEQDGLPGVDDDGNGYVDDVYGYNFYHDQPAIEPDDHATHVAGLIGAVNHNGTGIASVAGGDAGRPGARLMACQIIGDGALPDHYGPVVARAFKYAADNGAVICSNSWDYSPGARMPAMEKEAMDYFIRYAGTDADGVQNGPMKGGLVLFAAGNFATSHETYPAACDEVLAVTGVTSGGLVGEYANYGRWVDLAAFGGTALTGIPVDMILSTTADGWYGYAVGTSMAVPQVAGVAALLLQRFGGEDFTPEQLKRLLLQTKDMAYDRNPAYLNLLGNGLVSARQAMKTYPEGWSRPDVPSVSAAGADFHSLQLQWPASRQTDSLTVPKYRVYWQKVGRDTPVEMKTWYLTGKEMRKDTVSLTLPLLESGTRYDVSVVAVDDWNRCSEPGRLTVATASLPAPEVVRPISAWYVKEIGAERTVALQKVFSSSQPLQYAVQVTPDGVVAASLADSLLVLRAVGDGRATVTVSAQHPQGGRTSVSVPAVVHTTGTFSGIFPNPVSKTLHVALYGLVEGRVCIADRLGRVAFDQYVTASLFAPADVDVEALQSGVYQVTVSCGNRSESFTLMKR